MVTLPKFYRARISVTATGINGVDRTFESDFTQIKFHELVGRYTIKYSPPMDFMETGVSHYQFFKKDGLNTLTLDLKFWEIAEKEMRTTPVAVPNAPNNHSKSTYDPPIPAPVEQEPEKIQALLSADVIYKV
jgi:hypothetical protein